MKTKIILFTVISFGIFFNSCSKTQGCTDSNAINYSNDAEEDDGTCNYKHDLSHAVGSYNYSGKEDGTNIDMYYPGVCKIVQGSSGINIIFNENNSDLDNWYGEETVQCNNIVNTTNGFAFDVKAGSVVIDNDGTSDTYIGYNAASVTSSTGVTNYNGLFEYDTKEITFGITADGINIRFTLTRV
jgi:hypothetical protein